MAVITKDAKIPDDAPQELLFDQHLEFLLKYGKDKDDYDYVMSEFLRINGVYWVLTAVEIMGKGSELDRDGMIEYVKSCFDSKSGGFSPAPRHDPHILYTLSAVQIASILDVQDVLDKEAIVKYIQNLQNPDGSFCGDKWGEIDNRFTFCALAALSLLGRLDSVDGDKAVEFVMKSKNFDGGFGSKPGSESHAGLIYCCLGVLSIMNRLDLVDQDLLGWWLAERQLPSGGLNGRPEKLPDVCYSWWVLSSLTILGRLHWIDSKQMSKFILATQDTDTGGIADRPGDMPDPFHTLFGLAGLSMLGEDRLGAINPVFCMPQSVISRLQLKPQVLTF